MSWKNLVISKPSKLSITNSNLKVRQEDMEVVIPLQDLATIMIEDARTVITQQCLAGIADNRVILYVCNAKHLPSGIFLSFGDHSRQLKVLKTQIELKLPLKKRIWQKIVVRKIQNQADNLDLCRKKGSDELRYIADLVKSGDTENIEAYAAERYFTFLFGDTFNRQLENRINSALNYGYAILRGAVARSLVKFGFHPALGIQHRNELNTFNLADDFLEPIRPVVDLWTSLNIDGTELDNDSNSDAENKNNQLTREDRQALCCLLNARIEVDGKKYSLLTGTDEMVKSFTNTCRNSQPDLLQVPVLLPLEEHTYE